MILIIMNFTLFIIIRTTDLSDFLMITKNIQISRKDHLLNYNYIFCFVETELKCFLKGLNI